MYELMSYVLNPSLGHHIAAVNGVLTPEHLTHFGDLSGVQTKMTTLFTGVVTLLQAVGTVICVAGFIWGAVKKGASAVDVQADLKGNVAMISAVISVILIWVGPTIVNNFATSSGGQGSGISDVIYHAASYFAA